MNNRKTKLKLTDFECNLLGGGINEFRNKACSDGFFLLYRKLLAL